MNDATMEAPDFALGNIQIRQDPHMESSLPFGIRVSSRNWTTPWNIEKYPM
jgi:hypothetical protein